MKTTQIRLLMASLFFIAFTTAYAQSTKVGEAPHRIRCGIKTLIPNIAGGTAEFLLPVANNRISLTADYSRIGLPAFAATALDIDGSVKASVSYLAIGSNFYLNNKGRGGGPYLGIRYQQIGAKTVIQADESFSGEGKQKAIALLFGVSSAGHFWTGFEIGAGKPLGPATGTSVETVNGQKVRKTYSESLISVIPILNFKFGVSF